MGDQSDQTVLPFQFLQCLHGKIKGLGIQTAETFINKHRIQMDPAGIFLHHIRQAQSQRKGSKKGFPAGKGGRRSCPARIAVKDFQIEPRFLSPIRSLSPFAEKLIAVPAHFHQAKIRFFRYSIKKRPQNEPFQIDARFFPLGNFPKMRHQAVPFTDFFLRLFQLVKFFQSFFLFL